MASGVSGVCLVSVALHVEKERSNVTEHVLTQRHLTEERHVLETIKRLEVVKSNPVQLMASGVSGVFLVSVALHAEKELNNVTEHVLTPRQLTEGRHVLETIKKLEDVKSNPVQLMASGVSGVCLVSVALHAEKELNNVTEHVLTQRQLTEGRHVLETIKRLEVVKSNPVQLMASGVSGVCLVSVALHAEKELNNVTEHVLTQRHLTEGRHVLETIKRLEVVKSNPAQLMASGVSGVCLVSVALHAEEELNNVTEHVLTQRHLTEGRHVLETIKRLEVVKSNPVQPHSPEECHDKLGRDCFKYRDDQCVGKYSMWAREHCALRCGYCPQKLPCVDQITYCDEYEERFCSDEKYGEYMREKCRRTCDLCRVPTEYLTSSATVSTTDISSWCFDHAPSGSCWYYEDAQCTGIYESWARKYCPHRCGYCPGNYKG
ncbi:uncharacterized protein LOC133182493 [Saccostrea echinata]|uniref:uncharacterized protein LOC133182493 n=1 Tax=Saccostrea echinata TaxID=191078 RepID=UPI002A7FD78E|nr:uncharacterized protein LOC133182493 [Saccostrea echinata]